MDGMSLIRAIATVGRCRPQCLSNDGFMLQLARLARQSGALCPAPASATAASRTRCMEPEVRVRGMRCGEGALLATWHTAVSPDVSWPPHEHLSV